MTHRMRRTVAIITTLAAGSAGAVALSTPAGAAPGPRVDYGMNARSLGAYVKTNDVDVRALRTGFANTSCTRTLGKQTVSRALVLPIGDFLELRGVQSRNATYRNGRTVGIRSTSTVGQVLLGADDGPRLTLTGLRSTANAFARNGVLRTSESVGFEGLDITGVPGGTGPLGELLEALDGGVSEVLGVLREQDAPIEIPGLARISLGEGTSRISRGSSAVSSISGLRIQLLVGNLADVTVGDAYARIGKGATAGVLGMSTQALEGSLLDDAVGIGATNRRTIGCAGNDDRLETFRRDGSGLVSPLLVDVTGSVAQQRGDEKGARGYGMSRHRIRSVQIVPDPLSPLLPTVTVRDVMSEVRVDGNFAKKGDKRVRRTVRSSVGALLIRGQEVPLPRAGRTRTYSDGQVRVTRRILSQNFFGAKVTALRVTYLPEALNSNLEPVTLDLGVVDGKFTRG